MTTRFGRGRIYLASFNILTLKTPCYTQKNLRDISCISRVIADLVPNFVAMATKVSHCNIWLTPFDSPTPKNPIRRKHLRDISYTSRFIADFVPNFVVIATGVGRGRIWLASFNSPPPKTPYYTQRSREYLLYKPSYSRFCPKFRCHGNQGQSL